MGKKGGGTLDNTFNRKKVNIKRRKTSRIRNFKEQKGIFNKNETNHNLKSSKEKRREQKKLEKKIAKKERLKKLREMKRLEKQKKMDEE